MENDQSNRYETSLLAMRSLLREVGEYHWLGWIEKDLQEWRDNRSTTHHLSAYGGMGSFNDVVITIPTSDTADVWANMTFERLKSLCFILARNPEQRLSDADIRDAIGYEDATLAAFLDDAARPAEGHSTPSPTSMLQGWRCLACGYGEVSDSDMENFIARMMGPQLLFDAAVSGHLIETVQQLIRADLDELEQMRAKVGQRAIASGLKIQNRTEWMRPCPACGSQDTAVYRWYPSGNEFVAGTDNLPLQVSKT